MSLLVFVFSSNEIAVALNLNAKETATVPVAIAKFAQEYAIKRGVMAAGAVLSAIPAIIVLPLAQRHIVKGLTAGAVKQSALTLRAVQPSQFSITNPGTRENSPVLSVTTTAPSARPWAATQ